MATVEMQSGPIAQSLNSFWSRATAPDVVLGVGTFVYLLVGSLFLVLAGTNPLVVLTAVAEAFSFAADLTGRIVPAWVLMLVVGMFAFVGPMRRHLKARFVPAMAAIVYCSVFTCMFSMVKTNMSEFMPYWADALFTRFDVALHFGQPAHNLFGALSEFDTSKLATFYLNSWILPATFFPVLLVACDPDPARRRQFILLWMAAWVLVGNVMALAFLSYGPIFADLFPSDLTEAHAGALALFEREDAAGLLSVKTRLWMAYSGSEGAVGSGISAFPSVHISMATVFGLYIYRLGRDLAGGPRLSRTVLRYIPVLSAQLGAGYIFVYFALSVYLGWHYAVDGYVSLLIISGLYAKLASARLPVMGSWRDTVGNAFVTTIR